MMISMVPIAQVQVMMVIAVLLNLLPLTFTLISITLNFTFRIVYSLNYVFDSIPTKLHDDLRAGVIPFGLLLRQVALRDTSTVALLSDPLVYIEWC
jgi:hypothetical protein